MRIKMWRKKLPPVGELPEQPGRSVAEHLSNVAEREEHLRLIEQQNKMRILAFDLLKRRWPWSSNKKLAHEINAIVGRILDPR